MPIVEIVSKSFSRIREVSDFPKANYSRNTTTTVQAGLLTGVRASLPKTARIVTRSVSEEDREHFLAYASGYESSGLERGSETAAGGVDASVATCRVTMPVAPTFMSVSQRFLSFLFQSES